MENEGDRRFPGLVHDGSNCACGKDVPVAVGPTDDVFLCVKCMAEYDKVYVGKISWPITIKAKKLHIAAQQGLMDGSGKSQAIASFYKEGTAITVITKTFQIDEPE